MTKRKKAVMKKVAGGAAGRGTAPDSTGGSRSRMRSGAAFGRGTKAGGKCCAARRGELDTFACGIG